MNQSTTIDEVKSLLGECVLRKIKVEWLDSKNPEHNRWRRQMIQRKHAMIFDDNDLLKMRRELENVLRANGINPFKINYGLLKDYYDQCMGINKGAEK